MVGSSLLALAIIAVTAGCVPGSPTGQLAKIPSARWIWTGQKIESSPELYLYQGYIDRQRYTERGPRPQPIRSGVHQVWLVFRYRQLPLVEPSLRLWRWKHARWRAQGVEVRGIQIDHDSPTGRLQDYGERLAELRARLPTGLHLSITGLADWVLHGETEALEKLHRSTDEIVFQLYRGHRPIHPFAETLAALRKHSHPFSLGIQTSFAQDPRLRIADKLVVFHPVGDS